MVKCDFNDKTCEHYQIHDCDCPACQFRKPESRCLLGDLKDELCPKKKKGNGMK